MTTFIHLASILLAVGALLGHMMDYLPTSIAAPVYLVCFAVAFWTTDSVRDARREDN